MTLKEWSEVNCSKDMFIEYYERCMFLGLAICDDAEFKIGNNKHISISLMNVKDTFVKIPKFVDAIYNMEGYNYHLKELDLNNVTSVSQFAFYGFTKLEKVRGDKVLTVGQHGFRDCRLLKSISLPNARFIGDFSFYGDSRLENVELKDAEYVGEYAFSYTKVEILKMPKLKVLKPITYYWYYSGHGKVFGVEFSNSCKIYKQNNLFKNLFETEQNVYDWTGKLMVGQNPKITSGQNHLKDRYGYYCIVTNLGDNINV